MAHDELPLDLYIAAYTDAGAAQQVEKVLAKAEKHHVHAAPQPDATSPGAGDSEA